MYTVDSQRVYVVYCIAVTASLHIYVLTVQYLMDNKNHTTPHTRQKITNSICMYMLTLNFVLIN